MDVVSLSTLGESHLARAAAADNGRSSVTVYARSGAKLRQTVVALNAGQSLAEHKSPGDASVLCLQGRVALHAGESRVELGAGELVVVPPQRHAVEAVEPSVLLLTVALH